MRTQNAYYEIHGEGTPVLILHGWGGSSRTWQEFIQQKPRTIQWVIVDLPGFGQTNDPEKPYSVQDYAEWVADIYKDLPVQPEYLLTHSFGGRIAAKLLSQKNHPFKKAVLAAAAGIKPEPTFKQKIGKLLSGCKKFVPLKIQAPIKRFLYKALRIHDFPLSTVMQETFKKVVNEDLKKDFAQINIPVQLVWGDLDSYTPLAHGIKLEKIIPQAELTILKDIKHGIHRQAPEKLATICANFFKETN